MAELNLSGQLQEKREDLFVLKTKFRTNDGQTICNKKAPLPGALRHD